MIRSTALDPVPPQIGHDIGPAAYAGSQLAGGVAPPERAYAGLSVPVGQPPPAGEMAPQDHEIADAIAQGSGWMIELLARLVDKDTTLGREEAGQAVIRDALSELGLEPVDVPMDAAALRAHPAASPFDWEVADKRNVVATWSPASGFGASA